MSFSSALLRRLSRSSRCPSSSRPLLGRRVDLRRRLSPGAPLVRFSASNRRPLSAVAAAVSLPPASPSHLVLATWVTPGPRSPACLHRLSSSSPSSSSSSSPPPPSSSALDPADRPLSEHGQALAAEFVEGDRMQSESKFIEWRRDERLDGFAAELLALHAGSLELEACGDELVAGTRSSNGQVEHVGHGVFVEANTMGIDPDSEKVPLTITRKELRDVSRDAIALLELDESARTTAHVSGNIRVAVVGHPGIGKTRGGLAFTLQELLWRGEVVMRVGYKRKVVHLFVPDSEGKYRVWTTQQVSRWSESAPAGDIRTFVLIDPPEAKVGSYEDGCEARMIKFASNNADRHYPNFDKDGHLLFTDMPSEDEVVSMVPTLWSDEQAPLPGQKLESDEAKEGEVRNRCHLVGCVPRLVFNGKLFRKKLNSIREVALAAAKTNENLVEYYVGHDTTGTNVTGSVQSSLFFLRAFNREDAFALLNPLASAVLRSSLAESMQRLRGPDAFKFEHACSRLVHTIQQEWQAQGGGKGIMPAYVRPHSHAETSRSIASLELDDYEVVIASTGYPVLDFATSKYHWYNAKAGDRPTSVGSGAFVRALLLLGMARVQTNGQLVMEEQHKNAKIELVMMRNRKVELGKEQVLEDTQQQEDGKRDSTRATFESVQAVWQDHVEVRSQDMSDLSGQMSELTKVEYERTRVLLDKYIELDSGLPRLVPLDSNESVGSKV